MLFQGRTKEIIKLFPPLLTEHAENYFSVQKRYVDYLGFSRRISIYYSITPLKLFLLLSDSAVYQIIF